MIPLEDKIIGLGKYTLHTNSVLHKIKYDENTFIVVEKIKRRYIKKEADCRKIIYFFIKKWGYDPFLIYNILRRKARSHNSNMYFLGFKDRSSFSVQYLISDKYLKEEAFNELHKLFKIIFVGYIDRDIPLNDFHVGNIFIIKIKLLDDLPASLKDILQKLNIGTYQLPNYYGYQRFGVRRNNHILGLHILKNNYKNFIEDLLFFSPSWEPEKYRSIRKLMKISEDPKRIKFPREMWIEKIVYKYFFRGLRPYEIIKKIPKWYKTFLINAVQAYIFNRVLSKRIEDGKPIYMCIKGDYCIYKDRITISDGSISGRPVIPLLGFSYRAKDRYIDNIIKEVLNELELSPKYFYMNEIGLKIFGGFRPMEIKFIKPLNMYITNSTVVFSYGLERGSYATIVLREILKPNEPFRQGY